MAVADAVLALISVRRVVLLCRRPRRKTRREQQPQCSKPRCTFETHCRLHSITEALRSLHNDSRDLTVVATSPAIRQKIGKNWVLGCVLSVTTNGNLMSDAEAEVNGAEADIS